VSLHFTVGRPSPSKLPLPVGDMDMVPSAHRVLNPNGISMCFSHFCRTY